MSECVVGAGEVLEIEEGSAALLRDCRIEEGAILRLHYGGDEVPELQPTPDDLPVEPPTASAPVAVGTESPGGTADLPRPAAQAQTLEAPTEALDLSQVGELAQGDSTLMILLAIIAIVGGGTAWKFYGQWASQRHEQAMARIELERTQAGLGGAQPPPCQVKQAEVEKRLDALDKRQQETARKLGLLLKQDGPTIDELDERVVRLEKAARASRAS